MLFEIKESELFNGSDMFFPCFVQLFMHRSSSKVLGEGGGEMPGELLLSQLAVAVLRHLWWNVCVCVCVREQRYGQ